MTNYENIVEVVQALRGYCKEQDCKKCPAHQFVRTVGRHYICQPGSMSWAGVGELARELQFYMENKL